MKNASYNPVNYGLDEELFTARMRNMVLQTAPSSLFGPLVIILVLYLEKPIKCSYQYHGRFGGGGSNAGTEGSTVRY